MNVKLSYPKLRDGNGAGRSFDREKALSARAAKLASHGLDETLKSLGASLDGLDEADATERLERDGPNEVAHEKPPHWIVQLLSAFKNPFIIVLVTLAIIQYVSSPDDPRPIIIISVMVAISVGLQFWQEYRSALAAEKLKALVRTTATVLRREDGQSRAREVPIRELVPGDIVRLSAGDLVPADVRLMSSRDLFVSQAALTGEALPVEKYDTLGSVAVKSAGGATSEAGQLDQSNICFLGTNVVSGTATALVVATGPHTYFGSLARSIVGKRAETSFDRGVKSVSWVLIRFMLVMVPIVFVINVLTKGDWLQAFLFAVSVAVGLTPEMLPMLVSANLAKGAIAMARQKVVVKRLNAIQNLGAMDVLCTDKTGTLTQDRIILEHHVDISGEENERVLQLAWLNSYHQSGLKNLLDVAVIRFAAEQRAAPVLKKIDELPFDFARRRMSVIVQDTDGSHLLVCKGAVEETLGISTYTQEGDERVQLDDAKRRALMAMTRDYNEDGFRVIAVATRTFPPGATKDHYAMSDEDELVVQGFLAFLDPPKETAGPAIAALREHGIAVKILTGDNMVVTRKICREVGLDVGEPVLGRDTEDLDDAAFRALVDRTTVFAKVSPLQKARIIRTLQANGHTVGFLGDGINDAAALREADVGISVDTAADIAKEFRRHHPLGEEPAGARKRRAAGPADLRQHHQVSEDDGELELRQRLQRAGGERVPAVPADAAAAPDDSRPALSRLPAVDPVGPPGRGLSADAAQVGGGRYRPVHGLCRPDQLGVRYHHVLPDVVRVRRQQPGTPIAVPVGLVRREPAVADADRAHDPHAEDSVHPEHRGAAGADPHRGHHRDRDLHSVLAARRERRPAAVAARLLPLARRDAHRLLRADPAHQDDLHPQVREMAVTQSWRGRHCPHGAPAQSGFDVPSVSALCRVALGQHCAERTNARRVHDG